MKSSQSCPMRLLIDSTSFKFKKTRNRSDFYKNRSDFLHHKFRFSGKSKNVKTEVYFLKQKWHFVDRSDFFFFEKQKCIFVKFNWIEVSFSLLKKPGTFFSKKKSNFCPPNVPSVLKNTFLFSHFYSSLNICICGAKSHFCLYKSHFCSLFS